jgi:hypothetical protein
MSVWSEPVSCRRGRAGRRGSRTSGRTGAGGKFCGPSPSPCSGDRPAGESGAARSPRIQSAPQQQQSTSGMRVRVRGNGRALPAARPLDGPGADQSLKNDAGSQTGGASTPDPATLNAPNPAFVTSRCEPISAPIGLATYRLVDRIFPLPRNVVRPRSRRAGHPSARPRLQSAKSGAKADVVRLLPRLQPSGAGPRGLIAAMDVVHFLLSLHPLRRFGR